MCLLTVLSVLQYGADYVRPTPDHHSGTLRRLDQGKERDRSESIIFSLPRVLVRVLTRGLSSGISHRSALEERCVLGVYQGCNSSYLQDDVVHCDVQAECAGEQEQCTTLSAHQRFALRSRSSPSQLHHPLSRLSKPIKSLQVQSTFGDNLLAHRLVRASNPHHHRDPSHVYLLERQ